MGNRFVNYAAIAIVSLVVIGAGVVIYRERGRQPSPTVLTPPPFNPKLLKVPADLSGAHATTIAPTASQAASPPPAQKALPTAESWTWPELEAEFDRVRERRKMVPLAKYELADLYAKVSRRDFTKSKDYPEHITKLEEWRDSLPASPTPLVVLGHVYVQYAWDARGSGVAATVSEVGWVLFHDRIDLAQEVLEQAIALGVKDGEACSLLMTVAKAKGVPRSQAREWLDSGRKIDPDYIPMYLGMVEYLLPKWGGAPGEAERFTADIAEEVGGDDGLEVFGMLAKKLNQEDLTTLYWGNLDRDKLKRSAKTILDRYPQEQFAIQLAALVAWVEQDLPTARGLKPQIKTPDERLWGPVRYRQFARWCEIESPATGEQARVWGSFYGVYGLAFAPNSRYVWCPARGSMFPVHLVDTKTGKLRQKLFGGGRSVAQFDLSAPQRLLVGVSNTPAFRGALVWRISSDEPPSVIPVAGVCMCAAVSPAAPLVAIHDGKIVRLVELATEAVKHEFPTADDQVSRIVFSYDGSLLAIGCQAETAVWYVDSGKKKVTLSADAQSGSSGLYINRLLQFDREGRILCHGRSGSGTGLVRISADGQNHEVLLRGQVGPLSCVSADGTLVASPIGPSRFNKPESIEIWNSVTKTAVQQLPGHASTIQALAFSADNKLLASGTENGEIKIWQITSGP